MNRSGRLGQRGSVDGSSRVDRRSGGGDDDRVGAQSGNS